MRKKGIPAKGAHEKNTHIDPKIKNFKSKVLQLLKYFKFP